MICVCDRPIPCPDSASCAKCAKPCVAALQVEPRVFAVDPKDAALQYRRRVAYIARAQ